ncbi:MAG: DUF3794 domain-containing protein [Clostridia bacterium]|nr:DUF3794 domain-containing protein [Clostridia bacterium]
MNINERNKIQKKLLAPSFDGAVPSELAADYILPDTYPDVKKILRVRARPMLISRYVQGRQLEYTGAVDYIVVFCAEEVGEDGSPRPDTLHAVHFAGDFGGTLNELDDLDQCEICVTPRIAACSARLQNPRKLSIKSTVMTDVKLAKFIPTQPKIDGSLTLEEEMQLERLTETRPTLLEKAFTAEPSRISENLEPDASQPAIDQIITCDADIHFHEAKPMKGADGFTVVLKGEALIDCIYKAQSEPGDYRSFTRKIPLSQIVSADEYAEFFADANQDTLCASAVGNVTELNAAVGENGYGERRVLELDMTYDVGIKLCADSDVPLVRDVYSVERDSECEMRPLELSCLGKLISANFSVGDGVSRAELKLPESASIIDAQAEVSMNNASVERGRAQLTGEAAVNCILAAGDGNFLSADFTLPVKCELAVGDVREPIAFACDCTVSDMRARLDPTRLCCDFEVSLNAALMQKSRLETVSAVHIAKDKRPAAAGTASMTLCYPSAGESLWQIAKRYNTTTGAIEAFNRELGDMPHVILIPAGRGVSKIM